MHDREGINQLKIAVQRLQKFNTSNDLTNRTPQLVVNGSLRTLLSNGEMLSSSSHEKDVRLPL